MDSIQVSSLVDSVDPLIIISGVVTLGLIVLAPRIARWGIRQITAMLGGGGGVSAAETLRHFNSDEPRRKF